MMMGPIATEITRRLTEAFAPTRLLVADNSESHRGHGGHREGVQTHLAITMESSAFRGMSRIAMQRAVYAALADLMNNPIHALNLHLSAPE